MDDIIARPDLTLVRKAADIWPEPHDCPDYPLGLGNKPPLRADREFAQNRLEVLRDTLHPRAEALRAPTDEEAAAALAEHFRPTVPGESGGQQRMIERRGFQGLRHKIGSNTAQEISEAVHIHGYLRKLDAEDQARSETQAEDADRPHRRTIDNYLRDREAEESALAAQAEGYDRYRQFLADKRAFEKAIDLRGSIDRKRSAAERAAEAISVTLPQRHDLGTTGLAT